MSTISTQRSPEATIRKRLSSSRIDAEKIAFTVIERARAIPVVLHSLVSSDPNAKYGAAKVLRLVSERSPRLLYPYFDEFVRLLDSDNAFLRWDALHILGNLAAV